MTSGSSHNEGAVDVSIGRECSLKRRGDVGNLNEHEQQQQKQHSRKIAQAERERKLESENKSFAPHIEATKSSPHARE